MIDVNMLSTPEKVVYSYLTMYQIPFEMQEKFFGGVTMIGGSVVDFTLDQYNLALRVMGTYWHSSVEAMSRDRESRLRLMGLGYTVIDMWEDKLMQDPETVIQLALQGVEVPSG